MYEMRYRALCSVVVLFLDAGHAPAQPVTPPWFCFGVPCEEGSAHALFRDESRIHISGMSHGSRAQVEVRAQGWASVLHAGAGLALGGVSYTCTCMAVRSRTCPYMATLNIVRGMRVTCIATWGQGDKWTTYAFPHFYIFMFL